MAVGGTSVPGIPAGRDSPVADFLRARRAAVAPAGDPAAVAAAKAAAVRVVRGGGTSGAALARAHAFRPFATEQAQRLAAQRAAIAGDTNLNPNGRRRLEDQAAADHKAAVAARLATTVADLDALRAVHPVVPALGARLLLPPNRSDVPAYLAAAGSATPEAFAGMLDGAVQREDRPLADALAWHGRTALATRWAKAPGRPAAEQAIADAAAALTTPEEMQGQYADALAHTLEHHATLAALHLEQAGVVDPMFERPDLNPGLHVWSAFEEPADEDAALVAHFDATLARARRLRGEGGPIDVSRIEGDGGGQL